MNYNLAVSRASQNSVYGGLIMSIEAKRVKKLVPWANHLKWLRTCHWPPLSSLFLEGVRGVTEILRGMTSTCYLHLGCRGSPHDCLLTIRWSLEQAAIYSILFAYDQFCHVQPKHLSQSTSSSFLSGDSFIACRFQFSRLKLNFFLNSPTFALDYSWLDSSIFAYWSTRTYENDPKYRTLNTRLFTKRKPYETTRKRKNIDLYFQETNTSNFADDH